MDTLVYVVVVVAVEVGVAAVTTCRRQYFGQVMFHRGSVRMCSNSTVPTRSRLSR